MYDKFSKEVKEYLFKLREISDNKDARIVGTECLVLVMHENIDSLCYFLFKEYDLDIRKYKEILDELEIIRPFNDSEFTFTKVLKEVLELSLIIAKTYKSDSIKDEHLFYALLKTKCIATNILNRMDVDIASLLSDIEDIYGFKDKEEEQLPHLRNITKEAKEKKLFPFVGRKDYLLKMHHVLSRITKNNPLLIGGSGVGKTAIVEGLASYLLENKLDYEIVGLNLGLVLSGTKYRGDFEEKLLDIINYVKNNPNTILFIDEIHNIIGAGSSDGSMDAANILKPILTEKNIKIIGATTLDEYYKFFYKDKALSRRFQTINVLEPSLTDMQSILNGVKSYYEDYHQVSISKKEISYLLNEVNYRIKNRFFPDKGIDVLDECFVIAKFRHSKVVTIDDVNRAIENVAGISFKRYKHKLTYPWLNKYLFRYFLGDDQNNILTVHTNFYPFELIKEVKNVFNIKDEMVLEIDFKTFTDEFEITSILGAPPGYIGYDDEGILISHMLKYPLSLLVFSNLRHAPLKIKSFLKEVLKKKSFIDKKNRVISFQNTVIILIEDDIKQGIGFVEDKELVKDKKGYSEYADEHLYCLEVNKEEENYFERYKRIIPKLNLLNISHKKQFKNGFISKEDYYKLMNEYYQDYQEKLNNLS